MESMTDEQEQHLIGKNLWNAIGPKNSKKKLNPNAKEYHPPKKTYASIASGKNKYRKNRTKKNKNRKN